MAMKASTMKQLNKPKNLRHYGRRSCYFCRHLIYDGDVTYACERPQGPEYDVDFDPLDIYIWTCDYFQKPRSAT